MFREVFQKKSDKGVKIISVFFVLAAILIIFRLFSLQVLKRQYYETLALSSHELYQILQPDRGQIFFEDSRTGEIFPAGVNKIYYELYIVPKDIEKDKVSVIGEKFISALKIEDEDEKNLLYQKLNLPDDPYEIVRKKVTEEEKLEIEQENFKGVYFTEDVYRYYPEKNLASAITGFTSLDREGNLIGQYGIEGYWNNFLGGKSGFVFGEKARGGGWISLAGVTSLDAANGDDVVLTIDRALEYKACTRLKEGLEEYNARSASLVMVEANSGAILAMCSLPDYDPNNYSEASSLNVYNNNTIFTPYEPGSVFKPIVMSIAIEKGLVGPESTFTDPCERKFDIYTIHNAMNKCYGKITMTQVLENSVNTGMIWVEEKMPRETLKSYVEKFGFGKKTGIPMDMEAAGNISSLDKKSPIFAAQASFGQGLTVTPIQLAMAYTAFAGDGKVYQPFLVKEIRRSDGVVEKQEPQISSQVISPRTAKLIQGMLTSVVENAYVNSVKMPDYYLAGKTGTAQIPGPGGYTEESNHTFAGFAPATDAKFVLVIKYEAPDREWTESTAAVVFKDITDFALDYYGIEKDKR